MRIVALARSAYSPTAGRRRNGSSMISSVDREEETRKAECEIGGAGTDCTTCANDESGHRECESGIPLEAAAHSDHLNGQWSIFSPACRRIHHHRFRRVLCGQRRRAAACEEGLSGFVDREFVETAHSAATGRGDGRGPDHGAAPGIRARPPKRVRHAEARHRPEGACGRIPSWSPAATRRTEPAASQEGAPRHSRPCRLQSVSGKSAHAGCVTRTILPPTRRRKVSGGQDCPRYDFPDTLSGSY